VNLAPGGMPWLLRHELRLQWRNTTNKVLASLGGIGALVLMHLFALPFALLLRIGSILPDAFVFAAVSTLLCFVGLGMCSRALSLLVQNMYERGDGELLLSSPIAPITVVTARSLAITGGLLREFGVFLLPAANVFALFGEPRWLLAYLVLPCLALLSTALSLGLARGMIAALGPRHTRLVAQIVAALLGSALLVLSQVPQFYPEHERAAAAFRLLYDLPDASSPLWWPARAAIGESWLAGGLALSFVIATFAVTLRVSGRRFVADLVTTGSVISKPKRKPTQRFPRLRTSLPRVLIVKELRLLARDPFLLTQILQQNLYIIPLFIGLWRGIGKHDSTYSWTAFVMGCSTIAGALAWLASAGEDAPDLLLSAPLQMRSIKRAKLIAALLPAAALAIVPVGFLLARERPGPAITVGVCCLAGALTSALLHMRARGKRRSRNLRERYQGSTLLALIDVLIMIAWMMVAIFAIWWET
jgi:ABC-2 type transport system permease protein